MRLQMECGKHMFSVILPTYNRSGIVCRAIESVLRQSFRDFELLVADDGSIDGTVPLLRKKYAGEIADGRIRILELEHGGVCAARNAAIAAASGEWIAYVDSDNAVSADFLQTFADGMAANPGARNFYAALVRRNAGSVLDEPFSRSVLLKWNFIDMGVYCHHRDLIAEFGGFDSTVEAVEDWDLIVRHSSKYTPVRLGKIVMCYSDGGGADRLSSCGIQKKSTRKMRFRYAAQCIRKVKPEDLEIVKASHFFDGNWYSKAYSTWLDGAVPADHYLSIGWLYGCNPGPSFNGDGYLRHNRDVAMSAVNPLVHYETKGRLEGRLGFARRLPQSVELAIEEMTV